MRNILRLITCVCLLSLAAPHALAARVILEPEEPAAYVGQTITLQYRLVGAVQPAPAPELKIDGCVVQYAGIGRTSFVELDRGVQRAQQSFVYTYYVRPTKPGRFTIPPLAFKEPGENTEFSEASAIVSAEAPRSPEFRLDVNAQQDEVYVGQPVLVTWEWSAARPIEKLELEWSAPRDAHVQPTYASDPQHAPRGATVLQMLGVEAALDGKKREIDGRAWSVYSAQFIIVPQRAGELVIPAAHVLIEADTGRRRRGSSVFGLEKITERFSDESPPIRLRVRELPRDGRPADFSGLIGQYRIDASASPTSVRVGDPIELSLVVYGPEAAITEPELNLTGAPGFEGVFRVDDEGAETATSRGRTYIKQTVRAQRDDVSVIPPVELTYFDPELGRYATARSAPIPLEVSPTRVVTLADAQGGRDEDVAGAALESRAGGLRANVTDASALIPERFDTLAALRTPLGAAAVIVPPGLFAIAGAVALARSRRASTADLRVSRRALPSALGALKDARTTDDVAGAIRGYLATRLPELGAAVTPRDVTRLLGEQSDPAAELADVLGACDAARFGGSGADIPDLSRRAAAALRTLENGGVA